MSGLDIAARGLAMRALDNAASLEASLANSGAARLGHKRSEASAILEPVSDLLKRLDMSPAGFGALYNVGTSDFTALAAFTAAMTSAAQGLVRLEPKQISFGNSSASDKLHWTQSNAGLVGAGIDKTIIKNLHASGGYSMGMADCQNAYFSDMTFYGRMGKFDAAGAIRNVIYNRCKFTTSPTQLTNGVHFVADSMTEGVEFIYFIDCIFENAGRMNCEIQNNGAGTTVRYANIYFIRPRFIGAGQASAGTGFGLSLTGYGDNVHLDRPHFDGNRHIGLENIGCSRLRVRDMTVRASTQPTGKPCVSFSNTRPMYDCEIDGFTLVSDLQNATTSRPAVDAAPISISNAHRLKLNRISAAVGNVGTPTKVLFLNNNGAGCSDITMTNCDLASDSNLTMVEFLWNTGNHLVENNSFTSTAAARTAGLLATFGSGTVHIARNRISYASGTAASVFVKSGTGAFNVAHDNIGLTTRYRATHTITAGATTSTLANHGLPGVPTYSRTDMKSGGGPAWPSFSATQVQAVIGEPARRVILTGSKTYDAPSLADGAGTTTTVTVTGAALGDVVTGVSLGVSAAGTIVTGYVSAINTVTVLIQNESAVTVDLASTILTVMVRQIVATSVTVDVEAEYAF